MATPNSPSLKEHAAGWKKGTTWGTAAAVAAGDGITLTNDGGLQLRRPYQPLEELDAPVHKGGDLDVNDPVDFSPTFNCRYGGTFPKLLAFLFGADAVSTPGGTTPRLHTLTWADNLRGIFGTFVVERPGKIYEVASAKLMGMDLTLQNGRLVGTAHLRGNGVKDDSSINTATQVDALTSLPFASRLRFAQGAVRMNDESGATLVGTTPLTMINALDVSYRRAFDGEHALGSNELIEPEENGIEEITVRLGFSRFNAENAAFFSAFKAETLKKMMINFSGGVIETTYNYEANLFFPSLQIVEWIPGPQAGVVPAAILFRARQTSANPTGMSESRPYATIQETLATAYTA